MLQNKSFSLNIHEESKLWKYYGTLPEVVTFCCHDREGRHNFTYYRYIFHLSYNVVRRKKVMRTKIKIRMEKTKASGVDSEMKEK